MKIIPDYRHQKAAATSTVSFKLGTDQLGFWDADEHPARFVVEPGMFARYAGSSLRAVHELGLEVT